MLRRGEEAETEEIAVCVVNVIDEDELDFELDDFFKQGGLDVNDMKNPEETKEVKAGDINNENIDADLLHKLEQEKL